MDNSTVLPVTQSHGHYLWLRPLLHASRLCLALAPCFCITSLKYCHFCPPSWLTHLFSLSLPCTSVPVTAWQILALTNPISPCSHVCFMLHRSSCHPALQLSCKSLLLITWSIICLSSQRLSWPFSTQYNISFLWLRYQLRPLISSLCHSLLPSF